MNDSIEVENVDIVESLQELEGEEQATTDGFTTLTVSPFGALLGIELGKYGSGKAICRLILKPHHLNNGGRVHGGALTSLADTTAGVAIRTVRPDGKKSATTDLNISFIRPPTGDVLMAYAEVIHAGRRLFRTEIEIYSEEKLVAKTTATFMIV